MLDRTVLIRDRSNECRPTPIARDCKKVRAPRAKNPRNLRKHQLRSHEVLKDILRKHDVERLVRKGQAFQILYSDSRLHGTRPDTREEL